MSMSFNALHFVIRLQKRTINNIEGEGNII